MGSQSFQHCRKKSREKVEPRVQNKSLFLLRERDTANDNLEKFNRIRKDRLQKQQQLDEKLIDDQRRLTCQLNELKRYN